MKQTIRGYEVDVEVLEDYLGRGLSSGIGDPQNQVCVEAAICLAMGLRDAGDNPPCTAPSVRAYKIRLNDSCWSSPAARSAGMRDLAYAQIGTRGVLDEEKWSRRLAELTIKELLVDLGRRVGAPEEILADCRENGTETAARGLYGWCFTANAAAANAAYAAYAAADAEAAYAAAYAAAFYAAEAVKLPEDHYLLLSASLALRALQEQEFGVEA